MTAGGKRLRSVEKAIGPIFLFALINALLCWTAARLFRETFVFSATLPAPAGLPIVVGVCAYLLVLVNRVEREG